MEEGITNSEQVLIKVGRGTTFLLTGSIISYILGFFYRAIVARWIGPEEFGILSLMTMLVGIFSTLFVLAIPTAVTKYVPEFLARKEDPGLVPSSVLKLMLLLATVASLLMIILSEPLAKNIFHNDAATTPFRLGSIALFAMMSTGVIKSSIIGMQKMQYIALSSIAERAGKLIASAVLLYLGWELMGAVWGWILGIVAMVMVPWISYRKLFRLSLSQPAVAIRNKLIKFSTPIYLGSLSQLALAQAGTFLIGYFSPEAQVGYYSAALVIVDILLLSAAPLSTSLFPALSQIHASKDSNTMAEVFNRTLKYNLILLIPGAVGALLLAQPLMKALYGAMYLPGVVAMQILAVGAIFSALKGMGYNYTLGIGRPDLNMKFTLIAAVSNVILNLILIPRWGGTGAALSTAFTAFLLTCLSFLVVRRGVKLRFSFLSRCLLAAAVMALFIRLLPMGISTKMLWLVPIVVAGAMVYFLTLYLLGGFDEQDKKVLVNILPLKNNPLARRILKK